MIKPDKVIFLLSIYCLLCIPVYSQSTLKENGGKEENLESYVHELLNKIEEQGTTIDLLLAEDFNKLPLGIVNHKAGSRQVLAIDTAYAINGNWFFNIYASIYIPGTTKPLIFAGIGIGFGPGGISSSNVARMALISEHRVDISQDIALVLPGDGSSYLSFDCNGFHSLHLKGQFEFSPRKIIPDPILARGQTKVTASLETDITDLNNILISTSITPFQVRGLEGFSFEVKNATLDMSDIDNPPGFSFPLEYQEIYQESLPLWRGFYLQEMNIYLPGEFRDTQNTSSTTTGRVQIQARDFLLDELGVSGKFSVSNLLSLDRGDIGNWGLSIDLIAIELIQNRLKGGGLRGSLRVPFLGEKPLGYEAFVYQEAEQVNFRFLVQTNKHKNYNFFGGEIQLAEGCQVGFEKRAGKLIPQARLHGIISLNKSFLNINQINFQDLVITGEKPYVHSGIFSYVGKENSKMAGYKLRIKEIQAGIFSGRFEFGIRAVINLMNKEDKGFSGETFVRVQAKIEETQQRIGESTINKTRWSFDKIKVDEVIIKARTTALSLDGKVTFFEDDPTYGKGFNGALALSIDKVLQGIEVEGYFGTKDDYKYWYVHAKASNLNIPIPAPIYLTEIIGGASYHMVRQSSSTNLEGFGEANWQPQPGAPPVYLPQKEAGLTFRAEVVLIANHEKVLNGDAIFEIAFNPSGGLRYARFDGSAYFFTKIKDRRRGADPIDVSAPVYAQLSVLFDRENSTFHANLQAYLNLLGASLRGTGPHGLIGEAVLHFDPDDWYMYIGRSSQMLGVNVFGLAEAKCYFMIGTQVEDLPLPPPEVAEVFKDIDLNFMRDENALSTGRGFAAGLHLRAGLDKSFGPFYIIAGFGGGVDVMVRNYGENVYCEGRSGKGIGIKGWYASGQAYVFIKGDIGLQLKKKKKNKKAKRFTIVRLAAAALLQAKLPNPTWMRGRLAGKFKLLGGLIKGKFNIKFTVGEECEIVNPGNELGDIVIIADVSPAESSQDISVFTAPQVSFNAAIDQELRMSNLDNDLETYRVRLDEFKLLQNEQEIAGEWIWNSSHDVLSLKTPNILPANTDLSIQVKLHWEKKENGRWVALTENGSTDYETKQVNFQTGEAPDFIPKENIAYSYPIHKQYHFYKDEHPEGYIKLKWGQPELFKKDHEDTQWETQARFTAPTGAPLSTELSYDASQQMVKFAIPTDLNTSTLYQMDLLRRPIDTGSNDQNVSQEEKDVDTGVEDTELTVKNNAIEGTLTQSVEKNIYQLHFRSSQFTSFQEKLTAAAGWQDIANITTANTLILGKRTTSQETWDEYELWGRGEEIQALVRAKALPQQHWYSNTIYPWLYEHYGEDAGITVDQWRQPDTELVAPLWEGVRWENTQSDGTGYLLTDEQISSGIATAQSGGLFLGYYLSYYVYRDYKELRNKAASKYLDNLSTPPLSVQRILGIAPGYSKAFVDIGRGTYSIEVSYHLPGIQKMTSQKTYLIQY